MLKQVLPISLLAMSACSPYLYEKEVNDLSSGIKALADNASEQQASLRGRATDSANWQAALDPSMRVNLDRRLCRRESLGKTPAASGMRGCQLSFNGDLPKNDRLSNELAERLTVLQSFSKYAFALEAVTNATDSQDLQVATGALETASAGLVSLLGGPAGALTGEIVSVFSGLAQIALNAERHTALKASVLKVDATLPAASKRIASALADTKSALIVDASEDALALSRSLSRTRDIAARKLLIDELDQRARRVRGLQASDPEKLVSAIVKAHGALAKALVEENRDLDELQSSLVTLKSLTDRFKAAVSGDFDTESNT